MAAGEITGVYSYQMLDISVEPDDQESDAIDLFDGQTVRIGPVLQLPCLRGDKLQRAGVLGGVEIQTASGLDELLFED